MSDFVSIIYMSEDSLFEVEEILDKRIIKGNTQYLIKWKDFPQDESTWEPEHYLTNCKELLKEFNLRKQQKIEIKNQNEKAKKKSKNEDKNKMSKNEDKNKMSKNETKTKKTKETEKEKKQKIEILGAQRDKEGKILVAVVMNGIARLLPSENLSKDYSQELIKFYESKIKFYYTTSIEFNRKKSVK